MSPFRGKVVALALFDSLNRPEISGASQRDTSAPADGKENRSCRAPGGNQITPIIHGVERMVLGITDNPTTPILY